MSGLRAHLYLDLIGKPFARGGRGPDAYDCWGLMLEVLRRMGHAPNDYPSEPYLLADALADEWEPVMRAALTPGDGILLRSCDSSYLWHIGVAIDPFHMIHAREGVGVCLECFDSLVYARRIAGFYRYRGV